MDLSFMESTRKQLFLGAMLHDIGKFYQRSDRAFSDKYNSLSDYSKRLAEDLCPINDTGRFGYQHVIWTNEFIESLGNTFELIPGLSQNLFGKSDADDSLASFACNHHQPKTMLQAFVTMADWWSAGIDRTDPKTFEKEECNDAINWGSQRYKHIPLYSIFNKINGGNNNSAFGLGALSIDENDFFPKQVNTNADGISQADYKKLWDGFIDEFRNLPTDSFDGFAESLIYLLKKYTWRIPSNTMDMANVSLFEHLKTTAAFVDCLYLYYLDNSDAFVWNNGRLKLQEGVKPVILLGGDISGIQKFIYNISSKKAAVSLKGRSFYLQLLIDSVIQRIITHPDINCTIGQVVYSSGGKFYMLLPNTDKVRKAIKELRAAFEKELWDEHYGQLLLNMDYVPFAFDHRSKRIIFEGSEQGSRIGDLWKALADKLTACKNHKFKSLLVNDYDKMFEPQEISIEDKVCAVTGIEGKCVPIDSTKGEDKTFVLESVKEQAMLGIALKGMDYLLTYKEGDKSKYLSNRSKCNVGILQVYNYLFNKQELVKDDADFRSITSADVSRVKMINKLNFLDAKIKGQKVSYGFQFYGGNKQSQLNGENKTFEQLADGEYLGVLRMDVDGLGAMFINGLPEDAKSFAAYSTLSFMLDYFFSGYLNTIRNSDPFRDDVNILYSGGDDVFAVGKWDKLIDFAEVVRKDFARFVGREDISISAGIVFVDDKYPIAKAAQLAGDAEDKAKAFTLNNGRTKNAITIFGESLSWDNEFDFVKEYKNTFLNLIEQCEMPKSILHRLIHLYFRMKENDMSYLWHTVYFLKRFSEGKSEKVIELCRDIKVKLCNNRAYELIAVSSRWAELESSKYHMA